MQEIFLLLSLSNKAGKPNHFGPLSLSFTRIKKGGSDQTWHDSGVKFLHNSFK